MSGGMPASGSGIMQRMPQQPAGSGPVDPNQGGGMTYRNGTNEWSQFFGPTKGPIETAPYGSYRRENFALPDAYRGSNMYLTNVIITLVTEQDLWPVTVALPWRLTESEMEITWDQIIFDNALLGQVGGCSQLPTPPPAVFPNNPACRLPSSGLRLHRTRPARTRLPRVHSWRL